MRTRPDPKYRVNKALALLMVLVGGALAAISPVGSASATGTWHIFVHVDLQPGHRSGLSVTFQARLTATCRQPSGAVHPCSVPTGTVNWTVLGANQGGNVVQTMTRLPGCRKALAGAPTVKATCRVAFASFGDQDVQASFTNHSPSWDHFTQDGEAWVNLAAPVDLGAGLTYRTYDNFGPRSLPDCMVAAAANWARTSYHVDPAPIPVEEDYWTIEDRYHNADHGISTTQLFAFWAQHPIGGYRFTGATPVPISKATVEALLTAGKPLFSTVTLPRDVPPGSTGGGHGWVLVGFSHHGPVVVTWGHELQISWARFRQWTKDIYELSAASAT